MDRGPFADDGIPWLGPLCPECGRQLDAEGFATSTGVSVAYICPLDGAISMVIDPFNDDAD